MFIAVVFILLSIMATFAESQTCGVPKMFPFQLIKAGSTPPNHVWQWHVSVQKKIDGKFQHICSGILLTHRYVLTRTGCFSSEDHCQYKVLVGSVSPYITDKDGTAIGILKETLDYAGMTLLHLEDRVTSKFANPICIASQVVAVGSECYVTGFSKGEELSGRLQQDVVTILIANQDGIYAQSTTLADPSMNAKYDLGGPLVCFDIGSRRYELQGMFSHINQYRASVFFATASNNVRRWLISNI